MALYDADADVSDIVDYLKTLSGSLKSKMINNREDAKDVSEFVTKALPLALSSLAAKLEDGTKSLELDAFALWETQPLVT